MGIFPFEGAENNFAYQRWLGIFDRLPPGRLATYVISILIYYLCFRLGDILATRTLRRTESRKTFALDFVPLLYFFVFIFAVGFAYRIRAGIGMNYGDLGELFTAKGTLTAISLVLLALALLQTAAREQPTFKASIANRWMLGYFLIAFLLLAMGERLYVMTSLLLLVAYRSVFFKKFTAAQLVAFTIGTALFSALMGLVRLRTDLTTNALVLNLAFEPVFTGYSLLSFLSFNSIPWINFPKLLLGDLLNLVPSVLIPNKVDVLLDPTKAGYYFEMPLGALNSWVSFIINFGLTGTAAVMLVIGYGLRWLMIRATTPVVKTQYLMCSAFVVFTFFRDPFSVSLVKNVFEFSLITPFLCAFASQVIVWSVGSIKGRLALRSVPEAPASH